MSEAPTWKFLEGDQADPTAEWTKELDLGYGFVQVHKVVGEAYRVEVVLGETGDVLSRSMLTEHGASKALVYAGRELVKHATELLTAAERCTVAHFDGED